MRGKISPDRLSRRAKKALGQELSRTLRVVKKAGMYEQFIAGLLTASERVMAARRILIARRLLQGIGIKRIQKELGAGQGTIESVHRWLQHDFEDYRMVLTRMNASTPELSYTFRWLRKKYPLHFLLFNLIAGDPFSQPYIPQKERLRRS